MLAYRSEIHKIRNPMKVYVKKVDGVVLPQRGSELAAGYDIVATSDPKIVGEQIEASAWKRIYYVEY